MLGFPFGVLYGFALYKLALDRLRLTSFTRRTLSSVLGLSFGIGCAVSTQVRCICLLSIPTSCSRIGRAYISTFIITFVVAGPLNNIMFNAHESFRVMNCISSLSMNHSVERFKLMFKPVKEIILEFAGAGKGVQDNAKKIDGIYKPIKDEIGDEEEAKVAIAETDELDKEIKGQSRIKAIKNKFSKTKFGPGRFGGTTEKKYGMKSEIRCEGIFTKGVKGCYTSFGNAYNRCHRYLPIIGYLLCWPMKLTFICDLIGHAMGKRTCDSDAALNPGFGESIETANAVNREFDKDFQVEMQYKIVIPEEQAEQITPQDVSAAIENQFQSRKQNIDFVTNMISYILAFLFFQVLFMANKYCDRYLRMIQFDNKYITSYFRHIDARRRKQGKMTLLPLKKGEKLELSDPFTITFSAEEKGTIILNVLRLIGEMVTITIILMFDRTFYEFLMLIQRHSHVEYRQSGVHHISMSIHGNGFLGNMVRGILKGFDKKQTTEQATSTASCLPLPRKLDGDSIIRLYLIFLLIFVLILLESYSLRLRRAVCKFFYPKREKKRVLFIYNDRIKKRRSYLHHMKHRVRKLAKNQAIAFDTGVFVSLRNTYPRYCEWIIKLGLGKRKCLICEETEARKSYPLIFCSKCTFAYCEECWSDVKEQCYVCSPEDDESELSDDDMHSD